LGDGAGSPGGASACRTTNHHRRVGAGYSTGFHNRPADPDYDQGCGTRRNPDAARFD